MRKTMTGVLIFALCALAFDVSARFVSVDPVQANANTGTNFNRYHYANNNPYKFVDPDGRESATFYIDPQYQMSQPTITPETAGLVTDIAVSVAVDAALGGPTGEAGAIFTGIRAARTADRIADGAKASKVAKSVRTEKLGKFTKTTEVRPGKGPGQSRAEYVRVKNADGKTIRTHKDSYDRAGDFQGRKPLTGGPEGRPVPPSPKDPIR